jgi:hypothetical protein
MPLNSWRVANVNRECILPAFSKGPANDIWGLRKQAPAKNFDASLKSFILPTKHQN